MIARGDLWWADLGPAGDSAPAKRRPVLVIQAEAFNRSRLATVIAAVVTSNTQLAEIPGNVFLPKAASSLPRDSVANVSQVLTLDRDVLVDRVGSLPAYLMTDVAAGLRQVLRL